LQAKSRRGVSSIIGALIAISAMIVIGGVLMYYYGQMASMAEERLAAARENVRIVPVLANGTLYASLVNVGSQPVEIAYIILYNVTGEPQIIGVWNESMLLAPGSPGALIPLVPAVEGRYEIVAVSSLGSVFTWDPQTTGDGVLDIPADVSASFINDPILADMLGPLLTYYQPESYDIEDFDLSRARAYAWVNPPYKVVSVSITSPCGEAAASRSGSLPSSMEVERAVSCLFGDVNVTFYAYAWAWADRLTGSYRLNISIIIEFEEAGFIVLPPLDIPYTPDSWTVARDPSVHVLLGEDGIKIAAEGPGRLRISYLARGSGGSIISRTLIIYQGPGQTAYSP